MLRPSSATRLLTLHTIPQPLAFRNFNVFSALRRRTPQTPYRTRRSVASIATETPGSQHSILIHAPVLKDIEDSDYDADLIPPEEAKLGITQRAAEVRSLYNPWPAIRPFRICFRSARADSRRALSFFIHSNCGRFLSERKTPRRP